MLDERGIYLRRLVLRAMRGARKGHWGSAASLIEIMRVLYDDVAKYDPKNPKWEDRDRIILSKGHGVLAQAAILADKGFFSLDELDRFCKKDGIIGGHPSPSMMPGVECHTGSLGHGLPIGVGMALASRISGRSNRVFVICGDGEMQEGSVWEALMSAGKHRLDNLALIVDSNDLQSSGWVDDIQPLHCIKKKIQSFGWVVYERDGHEVGSLSRTLKNENADFDSPLCIIANTTKGKGISFTENTPNWHYKNGIDDALIDSMEAALDEQVSMS